MTAVLDREESLTPDTLVVGEVWNLTDAQLAGMSIDELTRLRVTIEQANRIIAARLKRANKDHAARRQRRDEEWVRRAHAALDGYRNQLTLIHGEYSRRKRGTKAERCAALHTAFVNVAHEMLPEKVFREWLDRAARASGLKDGST